MVRDMQIKVLVAGPLIMTVFALTIFSARCDDTPGVPAGSSCETSKSAFRAAKKGAEKAKATIDIIDLCGLEKHQKLSAFDAAFGTSFDLTREKKIPKGTHGTAVLYFDPQQDSKNEAVAAAYTGWYLAIQYSPNGLVVDYVITNTDK